MHLVALEVNNNSYAVVVFFVFQKLGPGMAMQEFSEIG